MEEHFILHIHPTTKQSYTHPHTQHPQITLSHTQYAHSTNKHPNPYTRTHPILKNNPTHSRFILHTHSPGRDLTFFIFIVIQLQLSAFSPHPSTPPQPNSPPSPTSTLLLDFVHVSFILAPINTSPLSPPHSPLGIVRLFLT